ncbi:uncharacterized protein [Prorops nasuta]|uniref:uncharacterized protein n=1 Tax=Prorops nasuta TaxID=863751 RepID=UPI0034CF2831
MCQNIVDFSVDATYYTRPQLNDVYQLLTVMGRANNKFIPMVWVLMSKKNKADYVKLFQFLKQSVLKNFKVESMMADFEKGLQNAIKVVFPFCKLKGCYFHFIYVSNYDKYFFQNVRKYARKLKIFSILKEHNMKTHVKGIFVLRKLFNLPLLPASSIKLGYYIVKANIENSKDLNSIIQFKKLLSYVNKVWLQKRDMNTISAFKCDVRTNNNQERYHRTLNNLMKRRPTFYNFIVKLKDVVIKSVIEIYQLRNNLNVKSSNRRRSSKCYEEWLKQGWDILEDFEFISNNKIKGNKIDTFLAMSAYKNEALLKRIRTILRNRVNIEGCV